MFCNSKWWAILNSSISFDTMVYKCKLEQKVYKLAFTQKQYQLPNLSTSSQGTNAYSPTCNVGSIQDNLFTVIRCDEACIFMCCFLLSKCLNSLNNHRGIIISKNGWHLPCHLKVWWSYTYMLEPRQAWLGFVTGFVSRGLSNMGGRICQLWGARRARWPWSAIIT